MAVYPDSIIFEVYTTQWEDISADVISTQECDYGFSGNSRTDRVADVGALKFTLRNDKDCSGGVENYYTPNTSNAREGWKKGIPVRLRIVFQESITKFYGHISDIQVDSNKKQARVTALDWMDYAVNFPLTLPTITTNKDISGVTQLVIAGMSNQPLHTVYKSGQDTYLTIFDTVKANTKALSELNKVALSELGYIYIKRDYTDGETLVVEGRQSRNFLSELAKIPQNGNFLLLEDGGYLLTENSDRIMLNSVQDTMFDSNMVDLSVNYGEGLANKVSVRVYPRKVDTAAVILFTLNSPISLAPGETKAGIKGTFRDYVSGASKVTGKNMITPVATTDYKLTQNSDGTGTNLTASLVVTAVYGAEGVSYTLKNNSATAGYVSLLQARGYGTYLYDPIEYVAQDTTSINQNGYGELTLDMKYQSSIDNAKAIADVVLQQDKEPRTYLNSLSFIANTDDKLMMSFLYLDIGDMVYVKESNTAIDGYFFIQGIKFTIQQGGIIRFTWKVVEALSLDTAYWILDTSTLGISTKLGY
jgi:hypothetical protein